jgi:tRNA(Ser,Leu) C12 N-acetylase TAN1
MSELASIPVERLSHTKSSKIKSKWEDNAMNEVPTDKVLAVDVSLRDSRDEFVCRDIGPFGRKTERRMDTIVTIAADL